LFTQGSANLLFNEKKKSFLIKMRIYIKKLFFFLLLTSFFIFFLSSCAIKLPALYRDGQPLSIVEYEKIAQKEYENGRYENAIKVYQTIIDNYPAHESSVVWAYYEIGYCYYEQENYETAEKYFRKVINAYQEPATEKLAKMMLDKIAEQKKK